MSTKPTSASRARGRVIARLRAGRDLSQVDLAEQARISASTVSRLERGGIPNASYEVLDQIAAVLGVSVADLDADAPRSDDARKARLKRQLDDYSADWLERALAWLAIVATRERSGGVVEPENRDQDGSRRDGAQNGADDHQE